MKRLTIILLPVLFILIAATILFSVLYVCEKNKADAYASDVEDLQSALQVLTDHEFYYADGLCLNANVYMKDLVCNRDGFTFKVVNNTRHVLRLQDCPIRIECFSSGEWCAVEFDWIRQEGCLEGATAFSTQRFNLGCVLQHKDGSFEFEYTVPHGLYRVILDMEDFCAVGYVTV